MSNDMERERFEAWARRGGFSTAQLGSDVYPPGSYADSRTHAAWCAWQARATPAPAEAPKRFHPDASHIPPDYRDGWNHCHDAWTRAAPPTAGAEREGWQWVPKESTLEMRSVGRLKRYQYPPCATEELWSAMLAAAPSAPSDQQGGRGCA